MPRRTLGHPLGISSENVPIEGEVMLELGSRRVRVQWDGRRAIMSNLGYMLKMLGEPAYKEPRRAIGPWKTWRKRRFRIEIAGQERHPQQAEPETGPDEELPCIRLVELLP